MKNSFAVSELLDIPYRTLMRWTEEGLLHPLQAGMGRGRDRGTRWAEKDIREASILNNLRRAGFSMPRLRKAIDYLRSIGHNPMSTGEFIVIKTSDGEPKDIIKFCDTGEAIRILRDPGQLVLPLWTPETTQMEEEKAG